jgi:hypothetical protein
LGQHSLRRALLPNQDAARERLQKPIDELLEELANSFIHQTINPIHHALSVRSQQQITGNRRCKKED